MIRRWRIWLVVAPGLLLAAAAILLAENSIRIRPYLRTAPDGSLGAGFAQSHGATIQAVQIETGGVILRAWYMQPRGWNHHSVILLHGVGDTRKGVMAQAGLVLRLGYAALLPDIRGHGESTGEPITYGVKERDDVKAWAGWLFDQRRVEKLYGFGVSLGAAILIQALAVQGDAARFHAVIAESPFSSFREVAYYRVAQLFRCTSAEWIFAPLIEPSFLYVRSRYGVTLADASPQAALRLSSVPLLLIHGTADTNIPPSHSEALARARPAHTEVWFVAGATHTQAYAAQRREYERRIAEWFARH